MATLAYRDGLLRLAWNFLEVHSPLQLKASIIHQLSVLKRLQGDVESSRRIINSFLSLPDAQAAPTDIVGPLYLSQAANYLYNFHFSEAHREAKRYSLACWGSISDQQTSLLWEQIFCAGRAMRGEGRFTEACTCFETCLRTVGSSEVKRFAIISSVADLYCELDYYHGGTQPLLRHAKDMLVTEIGRFETRDKASRGYRRMLLSLIEVEIRLGHDGEGRRLAEEILRIYDGLGERDILDRLGHVRALMASARVTEKLEEEERRWASALQWNRDYNPSEEEVFTCGVIYLFTGLARYRQGNIDGSRESLTRALQVLTKQRRQFLIPGAGTYMFDYICSTIATETGWGVDIRSHCELPP